MSFVNENKDMSWRPCRGCLVFCQSR